MIATDTKLDSERRGKDQWHLKCKVGMFMTFYSYFKITLVRTQSNLRISITKAVVNEPYSLVIHNDGCCDSKKTTKGFERL